jgi:hypothetical protein
MDPQLVEAFLAAAKEAYAAGGWLGLAAIVLVAGVNMYQADWLQRLLPARLQWLTWPTWGRILFVFLGSGIGAAVTAFAGGMAPAAAIMSALGVGITAVLGHKYVLAPLGKTDTVSAAAAALPRLARMTAILLPLDPVKVAEARAKREADAVLK